MVKTKKYTLTGEEKRMLEQAAGDILRTHGEVLFACAYGSFLDTLSIHDIDIGVYLTTDIDKATSAGYALASPRSWAGASSSRWTSGYSILPPSRSAIMSSGEPCFLNEMKLRGLSLSNRQFDAISTSNPICARG